MKKLVFIIYISTGFFISCNKKIDENSEKLKNNIHTQNNQYTSTYNDEKYMKNLLDKAILKGDTVSYKEAYKNYIISNHHKEFLYYSIKMAEKYNYSDAYYNTYHLINLLDNINGYYSENNKTSLYYLLKAYELHNNNAQTKVKELFIDKNIKVPSASSILNENK